ncbi:MAG: IgGFc-binding protein, partial [Bacteroidales bacterium]|nr:IgGFc-binding protein [Bacteroidales bacterium]
MIKKIFFIIVAALLSISSLKAQNTTEGKDFWVTFGMINNWPMEPLNVDYFYMVIRIVGGSAPTSGTIYFTNLDKEKTFDIAPYEIYNYSLENDEKYAVYNTVSGGTTDFSVRITTTNLVSVFALNSIFQSNDVTNILPVTALGTEYYGISYQWPHPIEHDACAVVATQNNTNLYLNGFFVGILHAGQVYYRASHSITGDHISVDTDKPVAFFAQSKAAAIHGNVGGILFQQLAPVHTWGKTFFVPATVVGTEYVRIVAAYDNTTITQTGGTIVTGTGGESTLTGLLAGQFVELEILLSENGCFIEADKPIGVCSYMKSYGMSNPVGHSSQVWIPALDQSVSQVLMAPFAQSNIQYHYAIIVASTATRDNTMVTVGGASPVPLSGDSWYAHTAGEKEMSFYNFPLTNLSTSHIFSNPAGIIVFGYGIHGPTMSSPSSYYYLAGSAMRDLSAAFTANYIPYNTLSEHLFCEDEITFVANIQGIHSDAGSLKWYINNVLQTDLTDQLTWSKTFAIGNHAIKMEVKFEDESTETYEGILKIESCGEDPAFYANDIHHQDLPNTTFCDKKVNFRAEIDEEDLHPDAGH